MYKLILGLHAWQTIAFGCLFFILFAIFYHFTYSGTKVVRAQRIDYHPISVTYNIADSSIQLIRVDTNYKVGEIYSGWIYYYRIIP